MRLSTFELCLAAFFGSLFLACARPPEPAAPGLAPVVPAGPAVSFETDVKPILEHRCVVCHGCYDAPCQLLLSSYDGISRGANKNAVYDSSRLEAVPPTRLFVDATSTAEWRERGFFPVVKQEQDSTGGGWASFLLERMISLGHSHPLPANQKLPQSVLLDINRTLRCATAEEFDDYAAKNPWGGMPYGMAPLSDEEFYTLERWLAQGAPGPPRPPALPEDLAVQVRAWESFLNGTSRKEQLTSRYLYEHLFAAHLYFENGTPGHYFEIVRSRTAPGTPIEEIATVRPYDDPGNGPFYYRLRPIRGTIVNKTHIVYPLGPNRLARYRALFLETDWDVETLPSYDEKVAANPFITFAAIPARSRYQFLLDDAGYFVMTFIRGPVCRGQVAVDVIEDRFWVSFLDPGYDLSVTDPTFLPAAAPLLMLPAEDAGHFAPGDLWARHWVTWRRYIRFRDRRYSKSDPQGRGFSLAAIWDGEKVNDNALLTVFRHFDNAEVEKGFIGAVPKTAWVVDYPIFERIYYDLVAGFNVFGGVAHQVSTRLYMDYLRMESEDLFLSFLPKKSRAPLRNSWYLGWKARVVLFISDRDPGWNRGTQIDFRTDDPKAELLLALLQRGIGHLPVDDPLNRCSKAPCVRKDASPAERQVEAQLETIASVRAPFVRHLPELSLLRVRDTKDGKDLVYTIVHDRAHENVAFMFEEESRLLPKDDILTILPRQHGSYPNFFFDVPLQSFGDFAEQLRAVDGDAAFESFVERWGVRRSSPRFWATADWFQADYAARQPILAGLRDLNRYKDP